MFVVLLQSLLVLVALTVCVSAEFDQDAAEQYFFNYGFYPSWYTNTATHFAAPVSTFKSYPGFTYSYPTGYPSGYPYSYFPGHYAVPVAAEKKVEEKSGHRVARSADEKHDQEAAEQYFAKYGFYPSWYTTSATHFATPYSYVAPVVATEKKAETETAEKTTVEAKYYPSYYHHNTYPSYGFAAPAAYKAASAVPYYPYNGNYHYGGQYFY